jgi:hypothetical protein
MQQTLKLNNEKWKKSSIYKEKSLVGFTLRVDLPNFVFLHFPIFPAKLSHFVTQEN